MQNCLPPAQQRTLLAAEGQSNTYAFPCIQRLTNKLHRTNFMSMKCQTRLGRCSTCEPHVFVCGGSFIGGHIIVTRRFDTSLLSFPLLRLGSSLPVRVASLKAAAVALHVVCRYDKAALRKPVLPAVTLLHRTGTAGKRRAPKLKLLSRDPVPVESLCLSGLHRRKS